MLFLGTSAQFGLPQARVLRDTGWAQVQINVTLPAPRRSWTTSREREVEDERRGVSFPFSETGGGVEGEEKAYECGCSGSRGCIYGRF